MHLIKIFIFELTCCVNWWMTLKHIKICFKLSKGSLIKNVGSRNYSMVITRLRDLKLPDDIPKGQFLNDLLNNSNTICINAK